MQKNEQTDEQKKVFLQEEKPLIFKEQIPDDIIKELTPEIRRQYFLWDEITKREVQLHPEVVLPLIEEMFHRKYEKGIPIELLSTEYAVRRIYESGEKVIQSIYSDLLIRVDKDLYHIECQMEEQKDMVLRMLEYDVHIALNYGTQKNDCQEQKRSYNLWMPKSVILYLEHSANTPDYEECEIHFADGTSHSYQVPIMKVQNYSMEMIEGKHLNMLIPFLPIRFRKVVRSASSQTREKAGKELTELLAKCIMILKREKENGVLTEWARNDIAEFLSCACDHLYGSEPDLIREVHEVMEPAIKLRREIVQELSESVKTLDERRKSLEENNRSLEENNRSLEENNRSLEENNRSLTENNKLLERENRRLEDGLIHLIQKSQAEGKSKEEVVKMLRELFSFSETEAKKKTENHWKEA